MKTIDKNLTDRIVYLDFLRIVLCVLVIFNHTGNNGFWLFSFRRESPFFVFYLFLSIFCRIAVPIYLMISGAVLLGKEESLAEIIKKRLLKYVGILLGVSAVFCIYLKKDMTLIEFFKQVYSHQIVGGLWFLYLYLGFLLALPLLRKMVKNMETKDYLWLTGVALLFSALKSADFLLFDNELSYNTDFYSPFISQIVYYPLLGYFLANKIKIEDVSKRCLLVFWVAAMLAIFFSSWMTCLWCEHLGEWKEATGQNYLTDFIFIPACYFFLLTRYAFSKIQLTTALRKVISILSSSIFGIYLFEALYRWNTTPVFVKASKYLPTIIACFIWVAVAFVLGFLVTQLWKFVTRSMRRFLNKESRSQ